MFQLDDNFLADVGLSGMPDDQKQAFLQHIYEELELRVGTRLSDGMTDAQLEEFEAIIDRNMEVVDRWLAANVPTYLSEPAFVTLQQRTQLEVNNPALKAEFAATRWLEMNRPNYRDVVAQVLNELKQEIVGSRGAILDTDSPAQAA